MNMTMSETMPEHTTPAPEPTAELLIDVAGVSKKYCRDLRKSLWYGVRDVVDAMTLRPSKTETLRDSEFWAIDNVSFQLRRGDAMGLLGRNGAGKSTLLKMISGQRSLSTGTITTRGRIVALNELGLGFNPVLTGRENAYVNAAVYGFSRAEIDSLMDEIIDFSGIREFIDSAVQTYSTGMKARLGFSVATHLRPDILVVDEVLAVGDLDFRRKCVKHIPQYVEGGGSIILVAHDPYLVQSMCNRCLVLDRGRLIFDGSNVDGVNFHFQLGHRKQFDSLADAAERVLGDTADEARAEYTETPEDAMEAIEEQPVVVESLELVAADGGTIRPGVNAQVRLRCRSREAAEVVWGFSFVTTDLQTNISSGVKGLEGDFSTLVPGENTLLCNVPELILYPGVYALRAGIGDAATKSPIALRGYSDQPTFFTVHPATTSPSDNLQQLHNSLVMMKSDFLS